MHSKRGRVRGRPCAQQVGQEADAHAGVQDRTAEEGARCHRREMWACPWASTFEYKCMFSVTKIAKYSFLKWRLKVHLAIRSIHLRHGGKHLIISQKALCALICCVWTLPSQLCHFDQIQIFPQIERCEDSYFGPSILWIGLQICVSVALLKMPRAKEWLPP